MQVKNKDFQNINDASIIYNIELTLPKSSKQAFYLGIPIVGLYIESKVTGKTEQAEYVDIWYDEDDSCYYIDIRGFPNNSLTMHSSIRRLIVFYLKNL